MFDYLYKFNALKEDLRLAVSSPKVLSLIENLEEQYGINLASIIMRVMTKDIKVDTLALTLSSELKLNQDKSEKLTKDLKEKIFSEVADYLGLELIKKAETPVKKVLPESIFDFSEPLKDIKTEELDFVSPAPAKTSTEKEELTEKKPLEEIKIIDKLTWAKEISATLNLPFRDEENKARFIALLDKYIRGIKNKVDVREVLGRDIISNGFSLSEEVIDNIFSEVDKKQNEKMKQLKQNINLDKNVLHKIEKLTHGQIKALPEKETYSFVDSQKKRIEAPEDFPMLEAEDEPELLEAPEEIELLEAPVEEIKEGEVDSEFKNDSINRLVHALLSKPQREVKKEVEKPEVLEEDPLETKKEKPVLEKAPVEKVLLKKPETQSLPKTSWSVLPSGKVKMDEIKRVKTMGPVDELKYMNLVDFHRLAENPEEIFEKISQKLAVLENIDYGKMLEGIKAWRQNPINKLYLNIFAQAGNEGKSVEQIIKERQSAGKEYLSKEEINNLIKFNKKISF